MSDSTEQARSWWPAGIMAGLGVVFVANAIMITFALQNPSVMVSRDPYADALDYDRVIAERDAARALGWTVDVSTCVEGLSATGCTIVLTVRDRDGRAIEGLSGSLEARRGDDAGLDRAAPLLARGQGRYEAELALARPGLYELSVRLDGGPAPWVGRFTELVGGRTS